MSSGKTLHCGCCKGLVGIAEADAGYIMCAGCIKDYGEAERKGGDPERTERLRAALAHAGAVADYREGGGA